MATTTNYGWILPTVGSDVNTWGTVLNNLLNVDTTVDSVDTVVNAISVIASAAMPKAGGEFSGDVSFAAGARLKETETVPAALEIDWAAGNFFTKNLSAGNNTFTFANLPADGDVQFITLNLRQPSGGNGTVTWPTVYWQDDIAPTLGTIGYDWDIITFFCYNGDVVVGAHALTAIDAPLS